jgi:hypothetical protein
VNNTYPAFIVDSRREGMGECMTTGHKKWYLVKLTIVTLCRERRYTSPEVLKLWDALSRGVLLVLCWGEGELFVRGTYLFGTKYGRKIKYIFWYALYLFEMFYLSISAGTGSELKAALFYRLKLAFFVSFSVAIRRLVK